MGTKKLRNPALYTRPTYKDLLARLAANTRRLREAQGWTQAEAAERCDMAVYVLQTVESGRANFTGTVIARLCEGFAVDVRELFEPAAPLAKRNRGRPRRAGATKERERNEGEVTSCIVPDSVSSSARPNEAEREHDRTPTSTHNSE